MTSTRILVVDDEIIIARELEARLVALGYQVLGIASTGRGAVELTERSKPDLVLMDIVLRGDMDGIEAAAEIRMRWGIPVIYVTAFADEATLLRAKITEPFGYIVKPFLRGNCGPTLRWPFTSIRPKLN
jgi:CheY-like chemotaxis protein